MSRYIYLFRPFITLVVLASIITGTAALQQHAQAAAPSTLIVAYAENPTTLDPAIDYDGIGPVLMRAAYESLVSYKGTNPNAIQGVLAISWTANTARTVWVFHLRKGVMFHDGTPVNAAAVQYSIDRILAINQAPAFILGQFMTPKGIKVLDPSTIQFNLTSPAPRLLSAMAAQWGNWIVSPSTLQKHSVKNDWGQAWIAAGHDAGSGPYMLTSYQPNGNITFEKFPGYWRGWSGPHIDRVIITFVLNEATRRSLIEKGGADITENFTPQDMSAMATNPQLKEDTTATLQNETLVATEYGPFASTAARQALSYAFDYSAITDHVLKGLATTAHGVLAAGTYGQNSSLATYPTNLAKARQLLAKAGIKPGTTVTLWDVQGDNVGHDIALVAQGQLDQIGLNVKLQDVDNASFSNVQFSTSPASKRPNLWVLNWYPDYNDPVDWLSPLYHTQVNGYGSANAGLYHNTQVDNLLAQASVTTDDAKRQVLYNQIQQILTWSDPAAVAVCDLHDNIVYRSSIKGYYSNPAYVKTFDFYSMSRSS